MIDIDTIIQKMNEEKDNIIAKAFTNQISGLLRENGIVPVMSEYMTQDFPELNSTADSSTFTLVTEYGVAFNRLDTTEHDAQIRTETINECINIIKRTIRLQDNSTISSIIDSLEQLKNNYK